MTDWKRLGRRIGYGLAVGSLAAAPALATEGYFALGYSP